MRAELPILSFISAFSLLVLIPFCLKSRNIPFIFLVAWLLLCNIIQGVNTAVWANNVSINALLGWCDIVTPITFAVRVALPAITVCLCRQLEMVSSSLDISHDSRSKFLTPAFHFGMSLFLPIVYILLHVIVQYQRFTIVENFGCEASIYSSVQAILVVWPLPLILCSITIIYAGLSLYNYHRRCGFFSQHLHPRSKVTKALFIRYIFAYVFIALFVAFVTIFDMVSRLSSGINPYGSWDALHSYAGDEAIGILTSDATSAAIRTEVVWWLVPASSIVLVVLVGSAQEVIRINLSLVESVWARFFGRSCAKVSTPSTEQELKDSPYPPSTGGHDPFKSSWDDTLQSSKSLIAIPIRVKPKVAPIQIPEPASPITSSPISPNDDCDASFMASTLNYVESPTGREALGPAAKTFVLPTHPPHVHKRPITPPYPNSPLPLLQSLPVPPRPKRLPEVEHDDEEAIMSHPWPRPPTPSRRVSFAHSLNKPARTRDRSYTFGEPLLSTDTPISSSSASLRSIPTTTSARRSISPKSPSSSSLRSIPSTSSVRSSRPHSIRQHKGRVDNIVRDIPLVVD